jgi:branched-chain amino acid transport system substrate-binding protein
MVKYRGRLVVACAVAVIAASCSSSSKKSSASGSSSPGASSSAGLPVVNQHFSASGALTASAPGVTPTTIKIGYITSQTGIAASSFKGGDAGAIARIDLQNDQGGVDGRKIVLVAADDGTIGPKAAAQQLIENDGVFGIIDYSAFVVGAAPYLQAQGVPVTGGGFDGPEWGQQPYTNMFSYTAPLYTPVGGKYYTYDNTERFLKSIGVTKLATFAYGISESSIQSNKSSVEAGEPLGISECYVNNAVGFGQTSFPTEALAVGQKGCNGTISAMVDSSDVGLSAALKQAGVTAKQFYFTGYDQSVLDDPNAAQALDGAYFPAAPNFTNPDTATAEMVDALTKYEPTVTGIPSLGVYGSYYAADIMIKGLEVAGANPTRASFISALRGVSNYTGGGLFSPGISFTGFGTTAMFPAQGCNDFVQLQGDKFVTVGKNVCGKLVATS